VRPGSRLLGLIFAFTTICGSLTTASPAFADAESDAKDLFARGRDLRNKGDCANASPLFYKAWRIYPQGLGNLRNHAECEEQLGHFASSRRAWLDIKRALLTAPNDPKYEGWDKDAEDAANRLKPKVAVVTVDVTVKVGDTKKPANEKSGIELLVNGEHVAPNLIGTPLERDPGQYTIRVQAPDAPQPVEQGIALAAGDNKKISLEITRVPKEGAKDPNAGAAIDPGYPNGGDKGGSGTRTLGWIAIGVGAASLVGSGVTFLLYNGAKSDLETQCGGGNWETVCPTNDKAGAQDIIDRGKLMGTLSPIFLGVGVVGIGAGVALLVTSPSKSTGTANGRVTVHPGLGRIDATWRF
jgi:hypothetical protein